VATFATAGAEGSGAESSVLAAHLVIEVAQVLGQRHGLLVASLPNRRRLGIDHLECRIAGGRLVTELGTDAVHVRRHRGQAALRVLELLHDLELFVLERVDAAVERTQLVLETAQVLRVGDGTRRQAVLVTDAALAH
jgi:hypothetical protein